MTPRPKASYKQLKERIYQCLQWINEGKTHATITREGSALWGVRDRQVSDYYSAALKIAEREFKKHEKKLALSLHKKFEAIYEKAFFEGVQRYDKDGNFLGEQPDFNAARQCLVDMAKLSKLMVPDNQVNFQFNNYTKELGVMGEKELLEEGRKILALNSGTEATSVASGNEEKEKV